MVVLGFALSSEEHAPSELVRQAAEAEQHGFSFALISDHYHPWTQHQGQSAFVWSALGAISQVTSVLQVGTGVTCPIIRIHPAILAQAAATTASLFDGRFFLGVGTGENLNEHVTGQPWPNAGTRLDMLEEAVELMRLLWHGGEVSRIGKHFVVDEAHVFSLPAQPVRVYVAVKGHQAIELAARIGDGLIGLAPDREITQRFETLGGAGKPRIAQVTSSFAATEEAARAIVHEWWPNIGLHGRLSVELKTPEDVEAAVMTPATVDEGIERLVIGSDPARYIEAIQRMVDAGYDHVYLHNIGQEQDEFIRFAQRELMTALSLEPARLGSDSAPTRANAEAAS